MAAPTTLGLRALLVDTNGSLNSTLSPHHSSALRTHSIFQKKPVLSCKNRDELSVLHVTASSENSRTVSIQTEAAKVFSTSSCSFRFSAYCCPDLHLIAPIHGVLFKTHS